MILTSPELTLTATSAARRNREATVLMTSVEDDAILLVLAFSLLSIAAAVSLVPWRE